MVDESSQGERAIEDDCGWISYVLIVGDLCRLLVDETGNQLALFTSPASFTTNP
jgi:hypothetical protein